MLYKVGDRVAATLWGINGHYIIYYVYNTVTLIMIKSVSTGDSYALHPDRLRLVL